MWPDLGPSILKAKGNKACSHLGGSAQDWAGMSSHGKVVLSQRQEAGSVLMCSGLMALWALAHIVQKIHFYLLAQSLGVSAPIPHLENELPVGQRRAVTHDHQETSVVTPFTPAWLALRIWTNFFFSSRVALDLEYWEFILDRVVWNSQRGHSDGR